jgi:hypothetical protein
MWKRRTNMDRAAIIERVARHFLAVQNDDPHLLGQTCEGLDETFEDTGIWELLDAAIELADERTQNAARSWDKLDAAIAKITGDTQT